MTVIHATGSSSERYLAELATVSAHVSVVDTDRSASIAHASSLHNWLLARAKSLVENGDATRVEADPSSTYAQRAAGVEDCALGESNVTPLQFTTMSSVRVVVSNLALVSELLLELAEAGAQTSVRWSLTEDSHAQYLRAARQAAVLDARAVAEDYADALGESVVEVIRITDSRDGLFGGAPRMTRAMMASESVASAAEITIEEIEVSASVVGEFTTR